MADATLSIAAVLNVAPPPTTDAAPTIAVAGDDTAADPFAELLAAMTEPVAAVPIPPTATPIVPTTAALPAIALAETEPALDDAPEAPAKDEDVSADPLGDAIAAGVTAVLALAQPVAQPVPAPTRKPADTGVAAVTIPAQQPAPTAVAQAKVAQTVPSVAAFEGAQAAVAQAGDTPAQTAQSERVRAQVQPDGGVADAPAPTAADADGSPAPQARAVGTPFLRMAPALPTAAAAAVIRALAATPAQAAQTAPIQAQASTPAVTPEPKTDAAAAPATTPPFSSQRTESAIVAAGTPHRTEHAAGQAQVAAVDDVAVRRADDTAATDVTMLGQAPQSAATVAPDPLVGSAGATPTADGIVQQQLSIAADGRWLDSLARDIAQSAGSGNSLHFRLEPPSLGALTVQIAQAADGASIRMTADNDTTRGILIDAQSRLVAEARAQGLRISETHVDLNNSGNGSGSQRWAGSTNQGDAGTASGQGRQSSPGHQPFVRNFTANAERGVESSDDSDALYA